MGIVDFFRRLTDDEEFDPEELLIDERSFADSDDSEYEEDGDDDVIPGYEALNVQTSPQAVDISSFDRNDMKGYIKSQCDIMENAEYEIGLANEEYESVTSYFSDIQLIETAPAGVKNEIERLAELISEITVDRRIFKSGENKISQSAYFRMERLEPYMPQALVDFQNNESYYETVRKDMKMLEGEQMVLRAEADELHKKQKSIMSMAKVSAIGLCGVFSIFLIASLVMGELINWLFSVVIGLAALMAIGLFWLMLDSQRRVKVIQSKLNKAAGLLNKVKIKYVNIASTVDYEKAKYGVKNSYELSAQYELYLQVKQEQERVARMTEQLSESEVRLEMLLKQLDLYDPHIWLAQVRALIDPKEMVEVRHGLSSRRQKLRAKIQYNENRIRDAKESITSIAVRHPERKKEVLSIIEEYEKEELRR